MISVAITAARSAPRSEPANSHDWSLCLAVTLLVFFAWTYPANQLTDNWTTIPGNWQQLRHHWEYARRQCYHHLYGALRGRTVLLDDANLNAICCDRQRAQEVLWL